MNFYHPLQVATFSMLLAQNRLHHVNIMTFESTLGVFLCKTGAFQRIKNSIIFINLRQGVQRSHSEACSFKNCTLSYTNFVFKFLVLYFGIKKEWLKKSLNTFSLAANILKTRILELYIRTDYF